VIVKRSDMKLRAVCVALALLLGASVRVAAAPSEERRLVLVEAPGNRLTKAAREQLHAAVAEVAAARGVLLAPAAALPAKLSSCALPGCLSSIAAASGAIFVLRVEASFAQESFGLALELWNSDSGKLLGQDRRDCPICDEQDLWGSAALMTAALLDQAAPSPGQPAAAEPPRPRVPANSAAPLAPSPPPTGETASPSRAAQYSGLALCLAGVAAIGVGAYYISVDGESAGRGSGQVRDTMKYGLPVTIGGGAALLAGAGLLAWSFWPRSGKVAVGPAGVDVAWRF
jgi:hypothetical protein